MRNARLAALGGPVCRAPTGTTGGGRRSKYRWVEGAPIPTGQSSGVVQRA